MKDGIRGFQGFAALIAALAVAGFASSARAQKFSPVASKSILRAGTVNTVYRTFYEVLGKAGTGDHFGDAIAAGDFNGDGYEDLAVGVPDEDLLCNYYPSGYVPGPTADEGAVNVLYGSAGGLSAEGNQIWDLTTVRFSEGPNAGFSVRLIAGTSHPRFGKTLAVGDLNGDGYDDLAIGATWLQEWDVRRRVNGILTRVYDNFDGAVIVLFGSQAGLQSEARLLFALDVYYGCLGYSWSAGWGNFGNSLAIGDFDANGVDDLAVGAPFVSGCGHGGRVTVFTGIRGFGPHLYWQRTWQQGTYDGANGRIAGAVEVYDRFGTALAAGDFDSDGFEDLAIGVPGEGIGSVTNAGGVNLLYGSTYGLSAAGNQFWSQDSSGVAGVVERADGFGGALAVGDFDSDGRDDLAIGVPGEDVGSTYDAGAVNVLYGSASGLAASGDQIMTRDNPRLGLYVQTGDHYGAALAAGDFNCDGSDDLAVGVPDMWIGGAQRAGAVQVLRGSATGLFYSWIEPWHSVRAGMGSVFQPGAKFGSALAAGDFDGNCQSELAIGVPNHHVGGTVTAAGSVAVLAGRYWGLTRDREWNQNSTSR
jgi:hypothetical protein